MDVVSQMIVQNTIAMTAKKILKSITTKNKGTKMKKITQKEINDFVKKENFIRAEYLGKWEDYKVYDPVISDKSVPPEDAIILTKYVFVKEDEIRWSTEEEFFESTRYFAGKDAREIRPPSKDEIKLLEEYVIEMRSFLKKKMEESPEVDKIKWIHRGGMWPSFDNLSFAYKNKVYSILYAELESNIKDEELRFSCISNPVIFLDTCKKYSLVPCFFIVDKRTHKPVFPGWNLVNYKANTLIDPIKFGKDEKVLMSSWELHNFAIQIAIEHVLLKKNCKILATTDMPGFFPNIWFSDEKGNTNWANVTYTIAEKTKPLPKFGIKNMTEQMEKHDGYEIEIGLFPLEKKPYRTSGFHATQKVEQIMEYVGDKNIYVGNTDFEK